MVSDKECLFCRMVRGEIPVKKVYEDAGSFAFLDINPRNPGHTLVIPKRHYGTVLDMPEGEAGDYFASVKRVAAMVKKGVNAQGISLSSSNGQAAGQVVEHVHFHVIPRFSTEGPVGLEGILTTKRLDDKTMDQIAQTIGMASSGASGPRPARPPAAASRPVARKAEPSPMKTAPKPTTGEHEKAKHKKPKEDEEFEDLDDEISFDF